MNFAGYGTFYTPTWIVSSFVVKTFWHFCVPEHVTPQNYFYYGLRVCKSDIISLTWWLFVSFKADNMNLDGLWKLRWGNLQLCPAVKKKKKKHHEKKIGLPFRCLLLFSYYHRTFSRTWLCYTVSQRNSLVEGAVYKWSIFVPRSSIFFFFILCFSDSKLPFCRTFTQPSLYIPRHHLHHLSLSSLRPSPAPPNQLVGLVSKGWPHAAHVPVLLRSADTVSGCSPEEKRSNCSICFSLSLCLSLLFWMCL